MTVIAVLVRADPPVGQKAVKWRRLTNRVKPPATPPPSGQMVRLIAGFGGFLGRKHHVYPGPKAFWEGMQEVRAFAIALDGRPCPVYR